MTPWSAACAARLGPRGVGLRRGVDVAVNPFPQAARPNRACGLAPHPALRVSRSLINRWVVPG